MNRRKFLKMLGVGLLGSVLPVNVSGTTASFTTTSNSNNLSTEERLITTTFTYGIYSTTTTRSTPNFDPSNLRTPSMRKER